MKLVQPGDIDTDDEFAATLRPGAPHDDRLAQGSEDAFRESGPVLRTNSKVESRGILVVEDDPDLQWRIARTLTLRGFRVVGTSSGDGALALLRAWRVGIILIDSGLPGMDGFEVARRVAELAPRASIVMMTTGTDRLTHRRAATAGAVGVVSKPFEIEDLMEVLDAVLNNRPDGRHSQAG